MPIWNNLKLDFENCAHCGKDFILSRPKNLGQVTLCNCKSSTPTTIDINRFLSGFSKERAEILYGEYCSRKTAKWKPSDPDTGSLDANIRRYGEVNGRLKYERLCKSKITTDISYFLSKADTYEEAVKMQENRQAVGRIEKYIERYGMMEGVAKWVARNKKWSETVHGKKAKIDSSIPPELKIERDRKLQYAYCVGILTDIAARMFPNSIPRNQESITADIRHLDHQFSKSAAFHLKTNVKIVSAPPNLKWLSKSENLAKKIYVH